MFRSSSGNNSAEVLKLEFYVFIMQCYELRNSTCTDYDQTMPLVFEIAKKADLCLPA